MSKTYSRTLARKKKAALKKQNRRGRRLVKAAVENRAVLFGSICNLPLGERIKAAARILFKRPLPLLSNADLSGGEAVRSK